MSDTNEDRLHLRLLRGPSEKVAAYTGLVGEVVVDTTTWQLSVQDGVTAGGVYLALDALATASQKGLMSAADKAKLDTVSANAKVTGVKGDVETAYRIGDVNLTPANIGASPVGHTHDASDIASGVIDAANIPPLDASKITTGTLSADRIPGLSADKIVSGTLNTERIPDLSADKITSGTLDAARVPALDASKITTGTLNTARIPALDASKITTGTFADARIPDLNASKITDGVFDTDRIPDLSADKITSGTLADERIPDLDATKITTGEFDTDRIPALNADKITDGVLDVARIPDLNASKITAGTLAAARIPNLDASKITTGTLNADRVPSLDASKIATGTLDVARIPDLNASKITAGTLSADRIPNLNASKITAGTLDAARIPNLDASKITSGTIDIARLPASAIERVTTVADDTARKALTTATVQNGDTVKVASTGRMYFVVDDTKLNSDDGYMEYSAGTAASVPWSGITGKPSSYYTHPSHTAYSSGLYKVTVDALGHVTAATAVVKADITALGIPSTNTTYSNATTSAAGLMSADDKTKLDGIAASANNYTHPAYTARTGKPTGNQTPGFGSTFTVSQITSDATGHVTAATDRTVKIPDAVATTSAAGLMSAADKTKLDGVATGANAYSLPTAGSSLGGVKTTSTVTDASGYTACPIISGVVYYKDTNTTYTLASLGIGNVKNYDQSKAIKSITRSGTTFTYTCLDGTTGTFTQQDNNTTYTNFGASGTNHKAGLVPDPGATAGTTKYLREDGSWTVPPNTNTWTAMVGATSSANGSVGYVNAVPPKDGYNTKYLRADGTWQVPPNTNTTYSAGTGLSLSGTTFAVSTVPIANGGTGATTRLAAIKNLTNENVSTNATHFLGLKSDWSKVGYFTLAEAKTLLGLGSAAYTASTAYAAASHTHSYLPLSGGTVTGTLILSRTTDASGTSDNKPALIVGGASTATHLEFDNNEIIAKSNGTTPSVLYLNKTATNVTGGVVSIGSGGLEVTGPLNCTNTFAKTHPDVTKGTNPTDATKYWTMTFCDKNGTAYAANCLGMLETSLTTAGLVSTYIRAMKNTASNSNNCQISCNIDSSGNIYTAAPTPVANDNTTKIATTAWVQTFCGTTKKYLTAHQSVSNKAVTLAWNTTSTIATIGSTDITLKMPANPNTNTTYSAGNGLSLSGTTFSCSFAPYVKPANVANAAYVDVVQVSASDKSTNGTANRVGTIRVNNNDGSNSILLGVHNEANGAPAGFEITNTNNTITAQLTGSFTASSGGVFGDNVRILKNDATSFVTLHSGVTKGTSFTGQIGSVATQTGTSQSSANRAGYYETYICL